MCEPSAISFEITTMANGRLCKDMLAQIEVHVMCRHQRHVLSFPRLGWRTSNEPSSAQQTQGVRPLHREG